MRWNATIYPNNGDKRKVTEFAFFPTLVEDKYVWLESYWSIQEYSAIHAGWNEVARYLK